MVHPCHMQRPELVLCARYTRKHACEVHARDDAIEFVGTAARDENSAEVRQKYTHLEISDIDILTTHTHLAQSKRGLVRVT